MFFSICGIIENIIINEKIILSGNALGYIIELFLFTTNVFPFNGKYYLKWHWYKQWLQYPQLRIANLCIEPIILFIITTKLFIALIFYFRVVI